MSGWSKSRHCLEPSSCRHGAGSTPAAWDVSRCGAVGLGKSSCVPFRSGFDMFWNHSSDRRCCTFDGAEWFLSRCGWLWRGTAWSDRFCPGGARSGVSWFSSPHGWRGSGFDARWWLCGWFSYVKARRDGARQGHARHGVVMQVQSRCVAVCRGLLRHGAVIQGMDF